MSRILYLLLLLILCACSRPSEAERYAALVEKWQGKEIKLPDVMTDALTGDTIDLSDADFTILTYVDSAGCTGCKMKLPVWKEFLNSIDELTTDYSVASLMIVSSPDKDELAYLIKRDNFQFPVINDLDHGIGAANGFPEEFMFRSFLLDSSRRVIAIGNPVYNNSVADMYKAIISGDKTYSTSGRLAVSVEKSHRPLGEIIVGKSYSVDFLLQNQSPDTVFIRKIIPSCHCTEAHTKSSFIPPASSLPINVVFKEDSIVGEFMNTVHIYYNDFDKPTILKISGNIIN
ncbi:MULTISPECIES: DUF1573 domain-containing protein [Bacteroidales]|jgi:hypothetical protein|uniref:DUF1573 domain-containing protein n=1 Tax=Bacteroidales TaxID=171549 RepID=UPI0025707E39|nr:DUF1573 domain-containing protein [Bacteroides acidifaciens]